MNTFRTYRSWSIPMAIWMLLVTSGLVLQIHFCSESAYSFSFIGEASSCHAQGMTCCSSHSSFDKNNDVTEELASAKGDCEKGCCKDKSEFIQLKVDKTFALLNTSLEKAKAPLQYFASSFNPIAQIEIGNATNISFKKSQFPLLVKDSYIQYQAFLS